MLSKDIKEDILNNIKTELENSDNLQKIKDTIFQILEYFIKPFQYVISVVILIIILIFILSLISIYINIMTLYKIAHI